MIQLYEILGDENRTNMKEVVSSTLLDELIIQF